MGEQVEREQGKPRPATGQWRRGRLRYQAADVLYEVLDVGDVAATIRQDGHESTSGIRNDDLARWPVVGIETAHGRVMVGERRREPGSIIWEVARVTGTSDAISGPLLDMTGSEGANGTFSARLVASWPLLPASEQGGAGPLARAAKDAVREPPKPYATREDIEALRRFPMPWDTATIGGVKIPADMRIDVEKAARITGLVDVLPPCLRCGKVTCRLRNGCERGPGIAALALPPARVAVEIQELPERWQRWGSP